MSIYRRPYIESSAFIAFIKGEIKENNHDCKKIVDSILQAAQSGDFFIYTSSLTIAEVFKNKKNPVLSDQENEDLRPYFRENYIRLVEVDREIGERANELCRTHKPKSNFPALRPNDAIHLACAERASCEVLLAYDPDLTRQIHDKISIEWPSFYSVVSVTMQNALPAGEPAFQNVLALSDGNGVSDAEESISSPVIIGSNEIVGGKQDLFAQLKADGTPITNTEPKA
jgi:predicted nucleic acid-binding protein